MITISTERIFQVLSLHTDHQHNELREGLRHRFKKDRQVDVPVRDISGFEVEC